MAAIVSCRIKGRCVKLNLNRKDAKHAREIAATVAILIDGLWLRHAKSGDTMDATSAIRHIECFINHQLAHERPKEATLSKPAPDFE